ncbi:MAG: hypothetical protein CTY16_04760 [Methylobacter sp.]|nr:MAG: hypothetical protein CTY16_04760 [Methylobacter sp.]
MPMSHPSIFISAVSTELHTARQFVAATIHSLGFEPVWQEAIPNAPDEFRQMLQDKIDACEGLVQIAGKAYGIGITDVDSKFGPVSYTQLEFLYAHGKNKKTWLIIVGDECQRDLPVAQLDLPSDPDYPDPSGYQAGRRQLQQDYLTRLKAENPLCHIANNDTELQNALLELRDELEEFRDIAEREQKLRFALIFAIFCSLIVLGIGFL